MTGFQMTILMSTFSPCAMTQHVSISPQAWVHSIVSLWASLFLVFCSHVKSKLKFLCSKTLSWFCISHAKHQVSSCHPSEPLRPILEPEAALITYFIFWPFKSQHIGAQPFPTCQAFFFLNVYCPPPSQPSRVYLNNPCTIANIHSNFMFSLNLSWTHLYKPQYLPSCFCFLLVYDKLPHLEAQSIAHFTFRQL